MAELISRRDFVQAGMKCAGVLALAGTGSFVLGALGGCSNLTGDLHMVQDMAGREVAIPETITRVFCSNPIGTVDLYLLDPDKMVGWNFRPTGDDRKYIPGEYLNLPALGVWMGSGATPNAEEIVKQSPQVILCYWTADEVGIEMADAIKNQTGVPALLIDYDLRSSPKMYRYLGEVIGSAERAEELAAYCEQKLAQIEDIAHSVPEDERKSVYIAQSTGGLSTDPVGSMHVTDALELINTANVADMPGTEGQGMGMPTVNIEQIMSWNPDAVLVSEYMMSDAESSNLYQEILASDDWHHVDAVKNGEVYRLPKSPFAWFGRPPSVVRLLGCMLLLKVLYPAYATEIDIVQETRDFYHLFYRLDLTDHEINSILNSAGVLAAS